MEEKDHFTQTLLPLLSHTAAHSSRAAALGSYSSFSLVLFFSALHSLHQFCNGSRAAAIYNPSLQLSLSLSLSLSALLMPIYRQEWCHQLQLIFNNGGRCRPLMVTCICQWTVLSICCTLMATNLTSTPTSTPRILNYTWVLYFLTC